MKMSLNIVVEIKILSKLYMIYRLVYLVITAFYKIILFNLSKIFLFFTKFLSIFEIIVKTTLKILRFDEKFFNF